MICDTGGVSGSLLRLSRRARSNARCGRQAAVTHLKRDLADGSWDKRHEHLRRLPSFDAGSALILSDLT